MLKEKCYVNSNFGEDSFVGLEILDNDIRIHFPLGYHLSDQDDEVKKDILLLLQVLASNTDRKDSCFFSSISNKGSNLNVICSYMFVIYDFFKRGYYKERIIEYSSSSKGKINWARTIKSKKPYYQEDSAVYLNFIIKRQTMDEDNLISSIHKYCVFRSFYLLGWLFTSFMPAKPSIRFDRVMFSKVLRKKLQKTFNDNDKQLFLNLLAIVDNEPSEGLKTTEAFLGTNNFEHIWEKMIDHVYGIANKLDYFPKTKWNIKSRGLFENSSLLPDTIMIFDNDVYVIDAKYYKYGLTCNPKHLPQSESINKQVTYGEYIYEEKKFRVLHGQNMKVYNAFLLPFDSAEWGTGPKLYIGDALSDWKTGSNEYEIVKGILLDVKYLMSISSKDGNSEVIELAKLIKESSC